MTQPICDVVLPDGTRCGYVAVGLTQRDRVTDLHKHQDAVHVVEFVTVYPAVTLASTSGDVAISLPAAHEEVRLQIGRALDEAFDEHGNLKPHQDKP